MTQSITVYTSKICPVCRMLKRFLDSNDIAYEEAINLLVKSR